jgi:tRNA (guanine37-N1)-methyltransferase
MRFDVITLFPKMFDSPFEEGLVAQAIKQGSIELHRWDLRNVTSDKHKTVDDRPFGGGDGMVLLPEVLKKNIR